MYAIVNEIRIGRHFVAFSRPRIHVIDIVAAYPGTHHEMTAARIPCPMKYHQVIVRNIVLNGTEGQSAIVRVLHVTEMNEDIIYAAGISPVVIRLVATLQRINAAIYRAKVDHGTYCAGIFGYLALNDRKPVIIENACAAAYPAPLVLLLRDQGNR